MTLVEEDIGVFRIDYIPPAGASAMTPIFPAHCTFIGQSGTEYTGQLSCGEKGLRGQAIQMQGKDHSETVLTVHYLDGTIESALVRKDAHRLAARNDVSAQKGTFLGFVKLGVIHIWSGMDHLLFLTGLLLLLHTGRALLWTLTSFTIGHSISLYVSSFLHPNALFVEVLIALSVAFVAEEVVICKGQTHFSARTALLFGLLHGVGFASGLREWMLPSQTVLVPLIGFNVGVELGQILCVLAFVFPVRRLNRVLFGYAMGAVAMAWTIQRFLLLFLDHPGVLP